MRLIDLRQKLSPLALAALLPLALPACGDDLSSSETDDGTTTTGETDPTVAMTSPTAPTTLTTTTPMTTSTTDPSDTDPDTDTDPTDPTVADSTGPDDSTGPGDDSSSGDTTGAPIECGNGVAERGEDCDGEDLGDAACPIVGDVACNDDCTLDMSACTDTMMYCNTPGTAFDDTQSLEAPLLDAITIEDDFFVSDVNVPVDITHTFVSDMAFGLFAPDGTTLELLFGRGCGGVDDVDAVFDADGLELVCAEAPPAVAGEVIPPGDLGDFIGAPSMGDWTLFVADLAGGDDGILNEWCVELTLVADDPVTCGDDVAHYGEACDGVDLNEATCEDAGDFVGGVLACADDCTLDTSGCAVAGCNGGAVDGEEVCDGADLAGETCESQGFSSTSGDLACNATCDALDTTACLPITCGDDLSEGDEVCDGTDVGGETCESQGFSASSGDLGCEAECGDFDTTACLPIVCGDDVIEGDESCEGDDLNGLDCTDFGGSGGTLSCADDCSFDATACEGLTCEDSSTDSDLDGTEDVFNRGVGTGEDCFLSGSGTAVFHDVYDFTTEGGASVTASTCDTAAFDTVVVIYQNADGSPGAFDPLDACANTVGYNDDNFDSCSGGTSIADSDTLVPGTYQVVVTSFGNGSTGDYTLGMTCNDPV